MKGKKERARAQEEHFKKAGRNYAWSRNFNPQIITKTDGEIFAYVKGATDQAERGNALVEALQRLITGMREVPGNEDAIKYLTREIKAYDTFTPITKWP